MSSCRVLALGWIVAAALLACGGPEATYDPGYAHNAPAPDDGWREPGTAPWEHPDVVALEEAGMALHLGEAPPAIEGAYLTDSTEIAYDDLGHEREIADDYVFEFSAFGDDRAIRVSYASEVANDAASGLLGEITGEEGCFTVFVMNVSGVYDGCRYQTIFIYSGCLGDAGIVDWQNGVVMAEKEGETCDALMDEGHRRIVQEEDGLARLVAPSA